MPSGMKKEVKDCIYNARASRWPRKPNHEDVQCSAEPDSADFNREFLSLNADC